MVSWKAPGSILEASGLDFGGFGNDFFEIFGHSMLSRSFGVVAGTRLSRHASVHILVLMFSASKLVLCLRFQRQRELPSPLLKFNQWRTTIKKRRMTALDSVFQRPCYCVQLTAIYKALVMAMAQ